MAGLGGKNIFNTNNFIIVSKMFIKDISNNTHLCPYVYSLSLMHLAPTWYS